MTPWDVAALRVFPATTQGRCGPDGVLMWIDAFGVAGAPVLRRPRPGARALVIAVQTRAARSGSYAMARAACTSSPAVSPFRLRITRRVESRIRLSSVVSSAKRSSSTIVRTNVESSTAEVGILVPLQAAPATTAAASTTARARVIIGSNAIWLQQGTSTGPNGPVMRAMSGAGTATVRRQGCAAGLWRPRNRIGGYPMSGQPSREPGALWITC